MSRARLTSAGGPRCVVVGGGVTGVTAAWRLGQAGATVALVDGGASLGPSASDATFAHVNASYAGYWDYVDLRRAGVEGYHRLATEPGGASWWHETGFLAVHSSGRSAEDHDRHLARLQDLGHPAQRVTDTAAIEPALVVAGAARAYHYPTEGHVDVPAMLADLTSRARALGVVVHADDPVVGLAHGSGPTLVRLHSGAVLPCDRLVVCAGRWTDDLLGMLGLSTRYVATDTGGGPLVPGLLVVTDPVEACVRGVVAVDDVNYRPLAGGRTMVWSGVVDGRLPAHGGRHAGARVVGDLADELLQAAAGHVPSLRGAHPARAMVTLRSMPADGLPIVGPVPGVDGVHVVLAHAAVTMAPVLANAVVAEVLHDRRDDRLEPFRPHRFLEAST